MTHKYYVNLTLGIDSFPVVIRKQVNAFLLEKFGANPIEEIPNQWIFSIDANSREEAKEAVIKAIALFSHSFEIEDLVFTLSVACTKFTVQSLKCHRMG